MAAARGRLARCEPLDMLIDSHHHLWSYSAEEYTWIGEGMEILRDDYSPDDLEAITRTTGIEGFVTVQARQSITETESLLNIAELSPRVLGVVGWVPLASPTVSECLERYAASPWLKGVRHVAQDEPDDRFLLRADFNRGVQQLREHGLVYDLLIYARQLPAAIGLADAHPDLPLVLDHIAKPTILPDRFDEDWERHFRELAKRPNVSCKFSGVVTEIRSSAGRVAEETWSIEQIRRYWEVALEAFTVDRLMFGSDWPVCLLRTSYARWLETVGELAGGLSFTERAALFGGNAARVYRLDASPNPH